MAPKRIRYLGELGKLTPQRLSLAAMLRARGDDNKWEEWLAGHESELLCELLDYYKLDRRAPNKWFLLAYRLAKDHVPAFTIAEGRGRGRPRKPYTVRDLLRRMKLVKPGRPRKWKLADYEAILEARDVGERRLRAKGVKRVTDQAAMLEGYAHLTPAATLKLTSRQLRAEAISAAKRLPEARKLVREREKNSG